MAKKKSSPKKKSAVSADIFEAFEIHVLRCIRSEASLNDPKGDGSQNKKNKTEIETHAFTGISPEENAIKCNTSLSIHTTNEDSPGFAIVIKCEFQVIYRCSGSDFPALEDIEKQSDQWSHAALFQAWPYMRQHANWIALQMGLPAITLPLLRFNSQTQRIFFGAASKSTAREA